MFNCCLILILLSPALLAFKDYFKGCDKRLGLSPGTSYLTSPYYPDNYRAGTSCRYQFTAPLDHYIQVQCTMGIPSDNGVCPTDNLWVDTEGDLQLRSAKSFCGSGSLSRESLFTELVIAYISNGTQGGKFRCVLTTTKQNCNCGWSGTQRILNGQKAAPNEFPSMVALKDVTRPNERSFCGGTIVAHRYILTAAHCLHRVNKAWDIVAIVGTTDLKNPSVSRYYQEYRIKHMMPYDKGLKNDIAVLETATNMVWSLGVGPVCLPPVEAKQSFSYETVDVIGFGTVRFAGPLSDSLQKIKLMVVDNPNCQDEYKGVAEIYPSQMCTQDYSGHRRDSCQHDSGGPIILRKSRQFLLGIIVNGKSCGESENSMGINTRITSFSSWILKKIGNLNCYFKIQ